jgi:hypothetical protein
MTIYTAINVNANNTMHTVPEVIKRDKNETMIMVHPPVISLPEKLSQFTEDVWSKAQNAENGMNKSGRIVYIASYSLVTQNDRLIILKPS